MTPKEEGITGYWSELSPKEVGDFSATAYFSEIYYNVHWIFLSD